MTEKTSDLFISIDKLKGIGYKRKKLFSKYGIKTIRDLLYFKPKRYIDRRRIKKIKDLKEDEEAVVMGKIFSRGERKGRDRTLFIVIIKDNSGFMELVFVNTPYMKDYFPLDKTIVAAGKIKRYGAVFQIFHPEFEIIDKRNQDLIHAGKIVPIYTFIGSGKNKISSLFIRRAIYEAIGEYYNYIPETIPEQIREKFGLLSRREALRNLHFPESHDKLDKALFTLKFEEFFFFFLKLFIYKRRKKEASPFLKKRELTEKFLSLLPFELTDSQKKAIKEIEISLSKPYAMRKLLQGDVGSGKTIVALFSALKAIENGYQVAFMAPTEILAEQHYETMNEFLDKLNIKYELLTGTLSLKEKKEIYEKIRKGETQLLLGTHALLEEKVNFKNLGLVIIDEQHKFGVSQRARLLSKGKSPHFLVMTATPIPRTLALTLYGDLDVITLKEMPPGRGEIETKVIYYENREEFYKKFFSALKRENAKAYIIAPLIEESDKIITASIVKLYKEIKNKWAQNINIAYIHGRMKPEEREKIMKKFKNGEIKVLVATTVIEVGIDVPDVKYMVIEGAERFGLSTLHQLRGRIARKIKKGYCFIFCSKKCLLRH